MDNKSNFRRGSVELLILYLLSHKDYYGYEISQTIKEQTHSVLNIPVGSLYPALYKLIDAGYITDYKKQVGKRSIRVYYHIEESGLNRLNILIADYNSTVNAVQQVLNYIPEYGDETSV
ncbi:MAG: PadR family transcriptional regulator [Lachnospiraceae bacterium]|nr:PadR family transcriptional regulator [Lachnospiraceae bacterium]